LIYHGMPFSLFIDCIKMLMASHTHLLHNLPCLPPSLPPFLPPSLPQEQYGKARNSITQVMRDHTTLMMDTIAYRVFEPFHGARMPGDRRTCLIIAYERQCILIIPQMTLSEQ
jgi:hypothetical protein